MKKIKYKIFQTNNRMLRFCSINELKEFVPQLDIVKNLDIKNEMYGYEKVFEEVIEIEKNFTDEDILSLIYKKFNFEHPKNYKGRSPSISDVISLDNNNYFIDSYKFEKLMV